MDNDTKLALDYIKEKIDEIHKVIYQNGLFEAVIKNSGDVKWIRIIGGTLVGIFTTLIIFYFTGVL